MAVDVSVIIPAYNAAGFVPGCLDGLRAQTLAPERFEIILVDDGSTDGTAAEARRWQERRRWRNLAVIVQANAGPAAARNEGIRRAQGNIVALLDGDCIPEPGWLAHLVAPLLENPDLAGVEGRTLAETEPYTLMDHVVVNPVGGFCWTCNMAYRRKTLLAVGGFDEGFPAPFCEDIDIAERVKKQGRIAFAPAAVVRHRVLERRFARHVRDARLFPSLIRLHRKHPGLLSPQAGFPAILAFQLRALLRPILSQRRELGRQPLAYLAFCLVKLLSALDTLCRVPQYYREFKTPLAPREPLSPDAGALSSEASGLLCNLGNSTEHFSDASALSSGAAGLQAPKGREASPQAEASA